MSESDAQNSITSSAPRLGEIGRSVARNIRGLTDQLGLPTFASSLADATQAGSARPSASSAPPTISAIRPGGRHLGTPAVTDAQPAPMTPAHITPALPVGSMGPAAAVDSPLMLMASAQAAAPPAPAYPATAAPGTPAMPGSPTAPSPSAAPSITGSGTRRDPLIIPYGTSQAEANAIAAAAAGGAHPAEALKPLQLKDYPKPEKDDRNGVLNWASTTPPTGKDLDRFISEARNRKAGWVTFEVDPGNVQQYDEIVERLTEAGIQPMVRMQDPYGDLPPEEVKAVVKDLRGQGVRYFQLFDGGNVASETPDHRVDVKDYAERWLAAAQAVVEGGGLPGIGALAPGGDFDDRGFMRQLLNVVKERGGSEVLGQSWLALRSETAGATAGKSDVENLAERAEWFDRISRNSLGRSIPIVATLDPAGRTDRAGTDVSSTGANAAAEQSERALKDLKRKLPSLFGVNRGTVEATRP
jgi:hypothetical protein